jgi:MoxR-like ATPase
MNDWQDDFNPTRYRLLDGTSKAGQDTRDGSVYVYSDEITLAVRVALATGRPLLLLGPPGSGKSSLAAYVARSMNWNYFEQVVTSRTRAQDLLWSFDAVRRLRDAHAGQLHPGIEPYLNPRVLWWAFNPPNARLRGASELPTGVPEAVGPGQLRGDDHPAVVLIDEVDKADPDVPNDLLVALGSQRFRVDELGRDVVAERRLLAFITSNNERSLPPAFLRRCVIHSLEQPSAEQLVRIGAAHFPPKDDTQEDTQKDKDAKLFLQVAKRVVAMRADAADSTQPPPSTAEYLDAVRACRHFEVQPGESSLWNAINTAVLLKKTGVAST